MKKINKKGFTIVELVIVIAVIAILAAVLIPTFSSLVKTAQTSSDISLVKNLNTSLTTSEILDGKNETMTDALNDVKEDGFDVTKLTPTNSDNDILWDENTNRFVLHVDGVYKACGSEVEVDESKLYKLWKIYNEIPALEDQTYSIYYIGEPVEESIEIKVGFDSNVNVNELVYESNASQNVIIRTNTVNTTLTVNALTDTINHYGNVGKVDVVKVDMNCYNEYGSAAYVKVTEGKVVAKDGGKINVLFANNATSSNVVAVTDGGLIEQGYTLADDAGSSNIELTTSTIEEVEIIAAEAINDAKVDEAVNRETDEANLDKACLNAITNVYYDSLSEAFNAVQNNETLVMLKDDYTLDVADLSSAYTLNNKKITLNLNGKKLVSNGSSFEIGQNSELTINGNGTIEIRGIGSNDSGILVSDNSTLNFENGSLFVENNVKGHNKTYGIFGSNNSTINIGKIGTSGPTIEAGVVLTTNGNEQFGGCTFNVYSGTLIGNRAQGDGDSNVVQLANTAGINTINIYGGKFIQNATPADGLNTIFELRYEGTKNINIYGGEFVCGQYMFRFNASAHQSNVFINDQTGMDYEVFYKCTDCANNTH